MIKEDEGKASKSVANIQLGSPKTIYILKETREQLDEMQNSTGESASGLIRIAIDALYNLDNKHSVEMTIARLHYSDFIDEVSKSTAELQASIHQLNNADGIVAASED